LGYALLQQEITKENYHPSPPRRPAFSVGGIKNQGVVPPCQNLRKIVVSAILSFLPSLRGGRDRGRGGAPPYGKEGTGEVEPLQRTLHKKGFGGSPKENSGFTAKKRSFE